MKHIGIFNTSGDVQTAIENEALLNPYVAKVSGALDYNSVVPTPPTPATMGTWSFDETEKKYSFQITETDYMTYWYDKTIDIGVLNDVYFNNYIESQPIQIDMRVVLFGDGNGFSLQLIGVENYENYEMCGSYSFGTEGEYSTQDTIVDPASSDGAIDITWDGEAIFTFQAADTDVLLPLTPINPEYPEASE